MVVVVTAMFALLLLVAVRDNNFYEKTESLPAERARACFGRCTRESLFALQTLLLFFSIKKVFDCERVFAVVLFLLLLSPFVLVRCLVAPFHPRTHLKTFLPSAVVLVDRFVSRDVSCLKILPCYRRGRGLGRWVLP